MKKVTISFLLLCSVLLTGCETASVAYKATTTGYNLSSSGETGVVNDDAIVVNTEKILYVATDTFDLFLELERDNEASLKQISPQIHVYAEKVRAKGKQWIISARTAKDAYKYNRTAKNHANLVTAYKTLNSAIEESKKYIDSAKQNQ